MTLRLPCTICGTISQVRPDAEVTFCTTCGGRLELGAHSYAARDEYGPKIYCVNCERLLDTADTYVVGSIFSCDHCGAIVCEVCARSENNKHYCPKCFTAGVKTPKSAATKRKKIKIGARIRRTAIKKKGKTKKKKKKKRPLKRSK